MATNTIISNLIEKYETGEGEEGEGEEGGEMGWGGLEDEVGV